ncbi:MAG: PKD domain-containing protein [Saprospiraceae bacterium]|nr:PKD domain-containing protein [Saprospiraceae bacterium]
MNNILFSTALKCCFFGTIALTTLLASCDPSDDKPKNDDPVTAAFTYNLQGSCPTPCQVCFTNTSQNADTYTWDFGNGQTSTEASPCVSYANNGTYTVTLVARNGGESSTRSQTITIQDNVERYKLILPANTSGIVDHLLQDGQTTYGMTTVDGHQKMCRFISSTDFTLEQFPAITKVNDLVLDLDGGILCVGTADTPEKVSLVKIVPPVLFNMPFARIYTVGSPSNGSSVVPKNTNSSPGYIIGGSVGVPVNTQAHLVNVHYDGPLQFSDPVENASGISNIFRNADNGSFSYVAIGTWFDPSSQKFDYRIFTVNENGIDHLPINSYPGIGNGYNDVVADAAQSSDRGTYAVVGTLDDKQSFLTLRYQNQSFSPPSIKQNFPSNVTSLKSVCSLANNQGFAVSGLIKTGPGFFDYGIYVAKIDNAGNTVWEKTLGYNNSIAGDIVATPDGGFIVGGQEYCPSYLCSNPVLYKLDSNGEYQ